MRAYHELSKAAAEQALAEYVERLPGLVSTLRARSGVPVLDGSVTSLAAVGGWFTGALTRDEPDGDDGLPVWWDPQAPARGRPGGDAALFSAQQLRLIDQVQAYVGQVLADASPGARWVVFRDKNRRHVKNGRPTLEVEAGAEPSDVVGWVVYLATDRAMADHRLQDDYLAHRARNVLGVADPVVPGDAGATPGDADATPGDADASGARAPGPQGGDVVVVRGDVARYLADGPAAVEALDEALVRDLLARLGAALDEDDDEGQWDADTLVWEVWLERDAGGVLRAVGWEAHHDAEVAAQDLRAVLDGVLRLADGLGARAWAMDGDTPVLVTPAYGDWLVAEIATR